MKKTHALLGLIFCGGLVQAKPMVFEHQDIQTILQQNNSTLLEQQFLNNYFTAANPVAFVDTFMQQQDNIVVKEKLLFSLANELAYQIEQPAHVAVIQKLKSYQPQVMVMHDEGPLPIPVFGIRSKSAGTENQWRARSAETFFLSRLDKLAVTILPTLQQRLDSADAPTLLGLKNAVNRLSHDSVSQLTQHFMQQPDIAGSYAPLVVSLAKRQQDNQLAHAVMPHLSATHATQIIRSSAQTQSILDHAELLMAAAQYPQVDNFAISQMKPLINTQPEMISFLMSQLSSQHSGQSAAFALSSLTQGFEKLTHAYRTTTSQAEQNNILLSLYLNPANAAREAISQLNQEQRINQEQKQWLQQVSGGDYE